VKLLLDENLSPCLAEALADVYPGSSHVHQCGLGSADDAAIWEYAKDHDYVIVSKDSDFEERSILLGCPPKVIWLRTSNCAISRGALFVVPASRRLLGILSFMNAIRTVICRKAKGF
jgi:predicted nuclease of predicted toxin-antitoxin system